VLYELASFVFLLEALGKTSEFNCVVDEHRTNFMLDEVMQYPGLA
jgi:hypothetical protein